MQNLLFDKEFLSKLDKNRNKTIYAKITALTFSELPIETIEGRVTGGTINLDGSSAVRRSCSLTIAAQDFQYSNYSWGLNTKFKLEIGVENSVDATLPKIIWFNQGLYLITDFKISHTTNNFTISISGKDKMCMLNGEIGGTLESIVNFGQIEEENSKGEWVIRSLSIPEIIRNMVHTYAGEPYWNIIINDLDIYGLELLEYRYDTPMYLYRSTNDQDSTYLKFYNILMDGKTKVLDKFGTATTLDELSPDYFDPLVSSLMDEDNEPIPVTINGKEYIFSKVEYGQTAGYRATDLVYAGDLIANVGETITSVLDKIRNMLSEFEYFYDLEGHFVFQKKPSFISTIWGPFNGIDNSSEEAIIKSQKEASADLYTFNGGELIISFNNNPSLSNLRNDYSVWGERTSVSGAKIPVHLRYSINQKPISYTQITTDDVIGIEMINNYNLRYNTTLKPQSDAKTFIASESDWREVIYQMALDYYKYNFMDDFEIRVAKANPTLYPLGQTGYEKYYIDINSFWRELYNPELDIKIEEQKKIVSDEKDKLDNHKNLKTNYLERWHNSNFDENITKEKIQEFLLTYNKEKENLESAIKEKEDKLITLESTKENFYYNREDERQYWNKNVYERPELLNFWFDFLDATGELQQYNTKNVGFRSKAINDTNIKSIYFRETPALIFTSNLNEAKNKGAGSGYSYIQIPEEQMNKMFSISAQGKSAKDKLDELIYQYGYCVETVNITAIPVYHLQPNTRIRLNDEDAGLDGEYIVNKISLPLTYNGTMTISAIKSPNESLI